MDKIEYLFKSLANFLWGDWLLVALLGLGMFYTIMTGCIQLKCVKLFKKGFFSFSRKQHTVENEKSVPLTKPSARQWQAVLEAETL